MADVACGRGTSSLQVARETGCRVVGIDLAPASLAAAETAAAKEGLEGSVRFLQGDAEALPLADASVDGVLCECSLCTFPDKRAAASELARVTKPGGMLALSDVTAEPDRLPAPLRTLEGRVACLGDARPLSALVGLVRDSGFLVERVEREDAALAQLIERVEARLRLARLAFPGEDGTALVDRGLELVAAAREGVDHGVLGYAAVVARRRPTGRAEATAEPAGTANVV